MTRGGRRDTTPKYAGPVDSLDDRGLVSGAARQGDQIIQWVLGRLLTLTCAEANLGAARRKTAGRRGRRLTSCSLGRTSNWPNPGALAHGCHGEGGRRDGSGDVPTGDRREAMRAS